MAEATLLSEIKASLTTHARSATFACGGTIPIKNCINTTGSYTSTTPIQVRFGWNGLGSTVNIPGSEPSSKEFEQLLQTSGPATFARDGEEVLDEEYRKAGKLDRGHFSTDFCPYEIGIVDTLTQILLPQTKQSKHARSVRAELYKLNIYSSPSGKFKPHVDTPRSADQLGSLVISLPAHHEGGQLAVRNAGNEVLFDWSTSANPKDSSPCIKWAAFYSDCEHEVLEVTSGHRITLTYNLFVTRGLGHLAGAASALDATTLPLYKTLQTALKEKSFYKKGHVMAIWLTHSYAHTNKHNNFLPRSLKGADMSLYETARALNLRCEVVPVIPDGCYDYNDDDEADATRAFGSLATGESFDGESEEWGGPMPRGKYTWINPKVKGLEEAQQAIVAYGNDVGHLDVKYSRAAMLVRIPPFYERGLPVVRTQSVWAGVKDLLDEDDYDSDGEEYSDEDEDDDEDESEDLEGGEVDGDDSEH